MVGVPSKIDRLNNLSDSLLNDVATLHQGAGNKMKGFTKRVLLEIEGGATPSSPNELKRYAGKVDNQLQRCEEYHARRLRGSKSKPIRQKVYDQIVAMRRWLSEIMAGDHEEMDFSEIVGLIDHIRVRLEEVADGLNVPDKKGAVKNGQGAAAPKKKQKYGMDWNDINAGYSRLVNLPDVKDVKKVANQVAPSNSDYEGSNLDWSVEIVVVFNDYSTVSGKGINRNKKQAERIAKQQLVTEARGLQLKV